MIIGIFLSDPAKYPTPKLKKSKIIKIPQKIRNRDLSFIQETMDLKKFDISLKIDNNKNA